MGELSHLSDEDLAQRCRRDIDAAERELLERYLEVIYWLPHRAFGAREEDLADFLLYAVERLRLRRTFARYDIEAGARFRTWIGVVLRNLYLDYLRARPDEPAFVRPLEEEGFGASPETVSAEDARAREDAAGKLLAGLDLRCRALFKLLVGELDAFTAEELDWIAGNGGRNLVEVAGHLAEAEEELCARNAEIAERHRHLAEVNGWRRIYAERLAEAEATAGEPGAVAEEEIERLRARLGERRAQHARLARDLSGASGVATVPYKTMARILKMNEGTLGSHLSRCRARMTRLLERRSDSGETP